jgi:hypothetical protein
MVSGGHTPVYLDSGGPIPFSPLRQLAPGQWWTHTCIFGLFDLHLPSPFVSYHKVSGGHTPVYLESDGPLPSFPLCQLAQGQWWTHTCIFGEWWTSTFLPPSSASTRSSLQIAWSEKFSFILVYFCGIVFIKKKRSGPLSIFSLALAAKAISQETFLL